jgi:hypothetical protein
MTQLESAKTETQKYCYRLAIYGYGGECKIGTIDSEIATYWQNEGSEFFEEYVQASSYEREELNKEHSIPENCQDLPEDWYDFDDICSAYGPEFFDDDTTINVIDDATGEEILEKMITESMLIREEEEEEVLENRVPVCAIGIEKGTWNFPIETNAPFDVSKLKIIGTPFNEAYIISKVQYEDEMFYQEESDTDTKEIKVFFN